MMRSNMIMFRNFQKIGKFSLITVVVFILITLFVSNIYRMLTGELTGYRGYNYTIGGNTINYSDGFVRRGLFGEILRLMNILFQPFISEMIILVLSNLFILYIILARMIKLHIKATYIIAIILSPSLILMHRWIEFFRTDAFLIALNIAASYLLLSLSFAKRKPWYIRIFMSRMGGGIVDSRPTFIKMLVIDFVIFTLLTSSALIHELSAFLLPPVMLIFFFYARKSQRCMHFVALSSMLIVIYSLVAHFKYADSYIIAKSWSDIYGDPNSFMNNIGLIFVVNKASALGCVNYSINYFQNLPLKIVLHIFLAVAVPLIVLLLSGITIFHSSSARASKIRCILIISCLFPLGLSPIASDLGRWFSFCAINIVVYSLLIAHPVRMVKHVRKSFRIISAVKQCIILFMTVILLNFNLFFDGYFYRNDRTTIEEINQIPSYLPNFLNYMDLLITRELIIKPKNNL